MTDWICPVCDDGRCLACTSPPGGHLRRLAETSPAYREVFRLRWLGDAGPTPAPPSLASRAASFAGALINHVAHGCPRADDAERERRLTICRACPRFDDLLGTCTICGCHLKIKAAWLDSGCPDRPPRW